MQVVTAKNDEPIVIWEEDATEVSFDFWDQGRVSINPDTDFKISIVTSKASNEGWVAIDDFIFLSGIEDCSVRPTEAQPGTTTTNPAETTLIPPSIKILFS